MAAHRRLYPVLPGAVWLLGAAVLAGCSGGASEEAAVDVAESVTVTSPVLRDGTPVPLRFTCDGANVSPALRWSGAPEDAQAWALVVDDPDAPGGVFAHWIVLDIPLEVSSVKTGEVPSGSVEAESSAGDPSYTGPCPPEGTHHYRFTVFALDAPTGLQDGAGREEALAAIDEHAIARGSLVATYRRTGS